MTTSAFDLPDRLAAKDDPALIAGDEAHFGAIAASLAHSIAALTARLDAARTAPIGEGQAAMDRDLEVHRLTTRLRTIRRFGLDLCLGHIVRADEPEPTYIGRLGLTDDDGRRLLIDWRSPAAEPFFAATHARPLGLKRRRRYRWSAGRITDYWDEAFTADGLASPALDDQSAFIASLGHDRSAQMRDVLGTIAADQDAIIRAGSRGALVVDGGPGTGKTVVALHRAAYLLYTDPRLRDRTGGLLFIGPHRPYLDYVADVLPSLGEDGVQTATLRDLVAEGAAAVAETDPKIAGLKAGLVLVDAIEPAVRFYEDPPTEPMTVTTDEAEVQIAAADWAEAFAAAEPGTPHNQARERVWHELLTILTDPRDTDQRDDDPRDTDPRDADADDAAEPLRASLARNRDLLTRFNRAWPLIEAADLVADLWSVPAYLRRCAPQLSAEERQALQRTDARSWTTSDLPLLDVARRRLGDPDETRRRRRDTGRLEAEREQMATVIDDLIAVDDSEMQVMSMLRRPDMQHVLVDEAAERSVAADAFAGPFAHVVVDEAQELTDAQWQMLLHRCPSRSFTIVGDRAQARHAFTESWAERLERVGFDTIDVASLSINYRTPAEIMAEAEPVIRAVRPDANVPTSIRHSGIAVTHATVAEREQILDRWLAEHAKGIACVIGDPTFRPTARVRSLSPELAKGLEFDLVVLIDPPDFGTGLEGAVDRYVAMTRATQQLVVLSGGPALPAH